MKAYLAIKFKEDFSNRTLIEEICDILKKKDIETVVMAGNEKWGEMKFTPKDLMVETFKEIDSVDLIVIEFSEKGVGLGIEAGYAFAKQKPVIVIAKEGSDISSTMEGVAKQVIFYKNIVDIISEIKL